MAKRLPINQGDKYGRLTIIKEIKKKGDRRQVLCKCECGNELVTRFTGLRFGNANSCGCYKKDQSRKANMTHGQSDSRLYRIWHGMKQRCLNKNSYSYKFYGAVGITICDEWKNYEPFKEWALKNGYKENLTIDRKNFFDGYKPYNCRFITIQAQQLNKKSNKFIKYNEEIKTLKEWTVFLSLDYKLIQNRLARGWSVEKAFNTPLQERYSNRRIR